MIILSLSSDEWSKRKEKMPVIPSSLFSYAILRHINECMKICQCTIIDIVFERQENP